ncbi:hypothetical protein ACX5K5_01330 [Glutamicibacter bergerei]|uniref:Uncharacterized protein n=1 Tax=Glutamicibacter bergerei TaxID=256702 RepID=A0ABV9MQR1_9MICC|nr:hypothetical protein [Glutamicibacter ardleyensis]
MNHGFHIALPQLAYSKKLLDDVPATGHPLAKQRARKHRRNSSPKLFKETQ